MTNNRKNSGCDIQIELKGVRTHNLKNIDVTFPYSSLTVVTGVSGSGKSSLVFDTLYSESYRRYMESLSGFARQYMQSLPKGDLDSAKNLPPSVAVRQSRSGANHRSTVATLTELDDGLQTLFVNFSEIFCPDCQRVVKVSSAVDVVRDLLTSFSGHKMMILAPLIKWKDSDAGMLLESFQAQGFTRGLMNGQTCLLNEINPDQLDDLSLITDRVSLNPDLEESRLADSVNLAFKAGKGVLSVLDSEGEIKFYSKDAYCLSCEKSLKKPGPAQFSFSHPLGACGQCQGYGREPVTDWSKVFPDPEASVESRGIKLINFGSNGQKWYQRLEKEAADFQLPLNKPFSDYSESEWQWIKFGNTKGFAGVQEFFTWLDSYAYKPHYRMHKARFIKYVPCGSCNGHRFSAETSQYRIKDVSLPDLYQWPVSELQDWLGDLEANQQSDINAGTLLVTKELFITLGQMTSCLIRLGLGYLQLNRTSATLSGGELQRIHLARCMGSQLTKTLYCLDEPATGLHPVDRNALADEIKALCKLGNTVVMVEHDQDLIALADKVVLLGPGAGAMGGTLVSEAQVREYLNGSNQVPAVFQQEKTSSKSHFMMIRGAGIHNLKNITVEIPLGAFTTICGLSGSGKSSLLKHCLHPLLDQICKGKSEDQSVKGLGKLVFPDDPKALIPHEVRLVDQSPLARSSRSVLMSYLGIYDQIRKCLAKQDKAIYLKLTPGSFSFNVKGGRCEECKGLGTVIEELSFLGDMQVICPECNGSRFSKDVLSVLYRGKNLTDIMELTVSEGRHFFEEIPQIVQVLDDVASVGLGYMTLGQSTSTYSGGEAQRLKLSGMLREGFQGKRVCFLLDEPSSGLSDQDIDILLWYFRGLVEKGHTLVVVEHHLDILRASDYLIELGPGAGDQGGELVFQGTGDEIIDCDQSVTAPFLRH